ncbi:MAG: type II secretion system protein [Fimbriimonadaceae bacterium]
MRRAFTLVEILVVMAIFVVLAALGWVAGRAALVSAKNGSCMSRLGQIGKALHLYASDHDTLVPPMIMQTIGNEEYSQWAEGDPERWRDCLARYANSEEVFFCPFDPHPGTEFCFGADMGTSLFSSYDTVSVTEGGSFGSNLPFS